MLVRSRKERQHKKILIFELKGRSRFSGTLKPDLEQHRYRRIECFHSRGQHLCIFIGAKESVCITKEFNSQRISLGHQHGRRFIVLGHQYGRHDVM